MKEERPKAVRECLTCENLLGCKYTAEQVNSPEHCLWYKPYRKEGKA